MNKIYQPFHFKLKIHSAQHTSRINTEWVGIIINEWTRNPNSGQWTHREWKRGRLVSFVYCDKVAINGKTMLICRQPIENQYRIQEKWHKWLLYILVFNKLRNHNICLFLFYIVCIDISNCSMFEWFFVQKFDKTVQILLTKWHVCNYFSDTQVCVIYKRR